MKERIAELESRQVGNNLRIRFLADYVVKVQGNKLVVTPIYPRSDMMRLSEPLLVENERSVFLPDIEYPQEYTLEYVSEQEFRFRWGSDHAPSPYGGEIVFRYNKYNGWH